MTECKSQPLLFQDHGPRSVTAAFDGGLITSDGGALLLRELESQQQIVSDFAACFRDYRDPSACEFSMEQLVSQRVFGLALGYEDVNDHDELRMDPVFALLCGRSDVTGADRRCAADKGKPLAGKSTLNRLELYTGDPAKDRQYKKIAVIEEKINEFFLEPFFRAHRTIPPRIWLDLDATDDRVHGNQEGSYYNHYYGDYIYLPLYIFCGNELLCAKLRTADKGGADGALAELQRLTHAIRRRWPQTEIIIRGDSGFCDDDLMKWCEREKNVHYLLGLAKNSRLEELLAGPKEEARRECEETGKAARVFSEFRYATLRSWACERRVIGKAEHLPGKANPRFVVTSLPEWEVTWDEQIVHNDARSIYEKMYCARGEMENRIKEQQLDLFADRTSTHGLKSNQLRMWMSAAAYVVINALRRTALAGTDLARAYCGTIRLKLFKVGGVVRVSVRRMVVSLSSSFPQADLFRQTLGRLQRPPTWQAAV